MGIFGDILEAAINSGINKLKETSRTVGSEIGKNLTQERIEKELSEKAKKNKDLNLLVEFNNNNDRCEFAEFLLVGMIRHFGLDEEDNEVSDEDYLRTFRVIQYGDRKNPPSAVAFYKDNQLLIAGRINERSYGISVSGKNSFSLCCFISRVLSSYDQAVGYKVSDELNFYDKKIYLLANQLINNPTQDDSVYGGIEELPHKDNKKSEKKIENERTNRKEKEMNEHEHKLSILSRFLKESSNSFWVKYKKGSVEIEEEFKSSITDCFIVVDETRSLINEIKGEGLEIEDIVDSFIDEELGNILIKVTKCLQGIRKKYIKNSKTQKSTNKKSNTENEIIALCDFFDIEYSSLNKTVLKKSYHRMITMYHPDKVNTLAADFKELAEKKTKEINEKYESLFALLEQREKRD